MPLAQLWMSFGVRPAMALGHSIGEFVAACLAEVFSLEDALRAVAERGRLIQGMPAGAMLAIISPAEQVKSLFPKSVSIGAINTPTACVASGPREDIAKLERQLAEKGISSHSLAYVARISFRDDGAGSEYFIEVMRGISLKPPQLPYVSNVTGEWITDEQATNPTYWGSHMRAPVLFHKGLSCIHQQTPSIFLEVGPGRSLGTLARALGSEATIQSSLAHASARGAGEVRAFLRAAAELWVLGAPINWNQRYAQERRLKRPLPNLPLRTQAILGTRRGTPGRAANQGGEDCRPGRCCCSSTSANRTELYG